MPSSRRVRHLALTLATSSIALGLSPLLNPAAADPATLTGRLVTVVVDTAPGQPLADDEHYLATDDGLLRVTLPAGTDIATGSDVVVTPAPGADLRGDAPVPVQSVRVLSEAVAPVATPTDHTAYVVTIDDPNVTGDVTPSLADALTRQAA